MNVFFYIHKEKSAWFNMAFDEWLFNRIQEESQAIAYLRLYTWDRNAITIGYNQKIEKAIDFGLVDKSMPVIRRITGGRAILHEPGELTFSLAANLAIFPQKERTLSSTNRLISETLVRIFEKAGIMSEWKQQSGGKFVKSSESNRKACFESISKYEISSGLAKIAGGAQRRIGQFFIHQGSLKINGMGACTAIGQKELSLNELSDLGVHRGDKPYGIDEFSKIFGEYFSRSLGQKFLDSEISVESGKQIRSYEKFLINNALLKRPLY